MWIGSWSLIEPLIMNRNGQIRIAAIISSHSIQIPPDQTPGYGPLARFIGPQSARGFI